MLALDLSVIAKAWKADLQHVDPIEFLPRLVALFRDERIRGKYFINSAGRSGIHQAALYRGWRLRLPGFNPANPPGLSFHEYDLPHRKWAIAVDFGIVHGNGGTWAELHAVAAEYGFHFPYVARFKNPEPWHAELRPGRGPIPTQQTVLEEDEDEMPKPDQVTSACGAPGGGTWRVTYEGGVHTKGGSPYFGSIGDLIRLGVFSGARDFIKIEPAGPTREDGYRIIRLDGDGYVFNLQWARDNGL